MRARTRLTAIRNRSTAGLCAAALGLALAAACSSQPAGPAGPGGEDGGPGDDRVAPAPEVSFHRDVLPILRENCQGCHVQGGIGPFPLTTYAEARAKAQQIVVATHAGLMPPWLPSDDCRPLQGVRRLSAAQLETLAKWQEAGTPEGDPADAPPGFEEPVLPAADLTLRMPQRYMPRQDLTDDYRCFVLDPGNTEDMHVTGFFTTPGNQKIVHHVIVFLVPPENVADVEALDAAEEGAGYTCFGGPGFQPQLGANLSLVIGGWAPGFPPSISPEGTGLRIPAGSRLVLQMHYNTLNGPGTDDLSEVGLYIAPAGTELMDAVSVPFAPFNLATFQPELHIPAGDPRAVVTADYPMPRSFRMYGTAPHMHLRGREIGLKLVRADGTEECLIDIPRWDFHWQSGYLFQEPIDIMAGDRLVQTCIYDNSAENQPLGPDGKPMPVTDVAWGERSTDEMCLTFSYATAIPE